VVTSASMAVPRMATACAMGAVRRTSRRLGQAKGSQAVRTGTVRGMRQATEVGQARGAVLSAVVDGNGTMAQLRPVWTMPTVGPSGFFASLTPLV
jgi:hypothetical protein